MSAYDPGRPVETQVGGAVRSDTSAVRQKLARVLEDHDAIAEQAPALLGVADDSVCRLTVRG